MGLEHHPTDRSAAVGACLDPSLPFGRVGLASGSARSRRHVSGPRVHASCPPYCPTEGKGSCAAAAVRRRRPPCCRSSRSSAQSTTDSTWLADRLSATEVRQQVKVSETHVRAAFCDPRAIMAEAAPFAERAPWTRDMVAGVRPGSAQVTIDGTGADGPPAGCEWLRR